MIGTTAVVQTGFLDRHNRHNDHIELYRYGSTYAYDIDFDELGITWDDLAPFLVGLSSVYLSDRTGLLCSKVGGAASDDVCVAQLTQAVITANVLAEAKQRQLSSNP